MRILFISNDLIGGNIAHILVREGHDVKLFIAEEGRRKNFTGLVPKTENWRSELDWVGKDGLIVFDDIGYGKVQDQLRTQGHTVFGGSLLADKLESDRQYAQDKFKQCGMQTVPIQNFSDIQSAIQFVRDNEGPWVIKQNGHASKSLNYVGHFSDGRDTINMLESYARHLKGVAQEITLQKRIFGVEIGVARYFNGSDWVGPIEMNVEYKKFFPGDLGPTTSEMGTLGWYDADESNKLFQQTLAKLKPHLQEINFRGDIDINCIVNETGAYPLEATPRFGSPIIHLHAEIHESPWGEFLRAVAQGSPYDLRYRKGYGIVVVVAVPPFPYSKYIHSNKFYGIDVFFEGLREEDMRHIHFEEVSLRSGRKDEYYISDNRGYILYVTGMGATAEQAAEHTYATVEKVIIPKMFYRNDIGQSFIHENRAKLVQWGYLKG